MQAQRGKRKVFQAQRRLPARIDHIVERLLRDLPAPARSACDALAPVDALDGKHPGFVQRKQAHHRQVRHGGIVVDEHALEPAREPRQVGIVERGDDRGKGLVQAQDGVAPRAGLALGMADLRFGQIGAGMRERIGRHARGKMALGKAVGITSVQVQRGGVTGIGHRSARGRTAQRRDRGLRRGPAPLRLVPQACNGAAAARFPAPKSASGSRPWRDRNVTANGCSSA
jgi:hypothetical protein